MAGFGLRYAVLVACTIVLFVSFVACGAQFYKVSVENDLEPTRISAAARNPSSPQYGLHAPNGWVELPIHFKVGIQLNQQQKLGLLKGMSTWETATGRQLFSFEGIHENTGGDSFKNLYSSLDDFVNGHYADHAWAKTGKPDLVLATTIWENSDASYSTIATSDIRFNAQHYSIGDSYTLTSDGVRDVVDMQSLATHELGHLIGLAHVQPSIDEYSIMNPALYIGEGMASRYLSEGDILRVQKIYGCQKRACDVEATLAAIEKADRDSDDGNEDGEPIDIDTAH